MTIPKGKWMNKIICGDAISVLKRMESEMIDCAVTSPPYGKLRDYKGIKWNESIWKSIIQELYRVTKQGGVVVWVVGDSVINGSESGTSFRQALYFMEVGFNLHDSMIYQKNGSSYPESTRYYQVFEYMFILSKGSPKTVNLIKDRKNKWKGSWGKRTRRNKNGELIKGDFIHSEEYGVRFNIWEINTGHGFSTKDEIAFEHPAIFPEELVNGHVRTWSNEGEVILDPFIGSGTVAVVARSLKRNFIGIDISPKYCELAKKRLVNERRKEIGIASIFAEDEELI